MDNQHITPHFLIKNLPQTLVNQKIICKFAPLYFQILSNGLHKVWCVGEKRVKIEVPKRVNHKNQPF